MTLSLNDLPKKEPDMNENERLCQQEKDSICQHVVGLNNPENRLDLLVEECGELIVARNHLKRNRISVSEFISEVADVEIMIYQMRVIFGDRIIDSAIDEKLTRLAGKLGI